MPRPRKVCAGVALLMGLAACPAGATVVDRGTFGDSETVADEICGIDVVRDSVFSGSFRIRVDKQSGGQAFFQHLQFSYRDVFTNPANGRSITIEGKSLNNELTARQVEGDVYEFTTIEAGQPVTVRDGAGKVVLRDRGVIRHRVLFDTLGDGTPGGVTLEDEIVGIGGPHPVFEMSDEEFCETVAPLLG